MDKRPSVIEINEIECATGERPTAFYKYKNKQNLHDYDSALADGRRLKVSGNCIFVEIS